MCVIAAINVAILSRVNHGQRGPYAAIFFAGFISCTGYYFLGKSTDVSSAIVANKICYLGACFLPMFTLQAAFLVCNLKMPKLLHGFMGIMAFLVFGLSATVGYNDIYYTSIEWVEMYGVGNYVATFGPGHMVFNFMLVFYVVANIFVIVYTFIHKKNVSYKSLVALSLLSVSSIMSFILSRFMGTDTLIMPVVYVFDQLVLLYVCYRVRYYDIAQTVTNALEASNADGYISVFSNMRFLGANDIACDIFPTLRETRVDKPLECCSEIGSFINAWVKESLDGGVVDSKDFSWGEKHYKFTLKILKAGRIKSVYLFKVEDDTEVYSYVQKLGTSNEELKSTVKSSARQINSIQEQMIVGMANMVESRDSNTGGHIKRTSYVMAILADELRREKFLDLSEDFFRALVKSAPMHDLGKIAIDDAILRKPGRFTPEEYEVMKTHPAKGAAIVENLLASVEDPEFVQIARNVALSHHERYDGRGYPNGLKGEEIPVEARIMAVADVYDALVSKRCYKDKFSFDTAYEIIVEGMGTQFDPSLRECFENSRDFLENYYMKLEEASES